MGMYVNFASGTIPIMYGGGDYEKTFPHGGFINARKFDTVKKLAEHMKRLSDPRNEQELRSYYQWQKIVNPLFEPGVELTSDRGVFNVFQYYEYGGNAGRRKLCQKLWDNNSRKSYVQDVRTQFGHCTS